MSKNNLMRFSLLLTLICFVMPAQAQKKTAADKTEDKNENTEVESKTAESEEETGEQEKDSSQAETPDKADDAEADAEDKTPADDEDEAEDEDAAEGTEEGEESLDEEDEEITEEDVDEEDTDSEEEAAEEETPKPVELDMKALGAIDPEKELQQTKSLEEGAEETKKAEDWTERAMDILELHGYYRLRPELYHKFAMRGDDAIYNRTAAQSKQTRDYKNNTLAGANMRFRLEPTLNISEEIRIKSQFDFLDNVMLGSTPRYWQQGFGAGTGTGDTIQVGRVQGWNMGPPNSEDMVVVRRVWGEVLTPLGQIRFGRMGDHWGLGMLHNSGNGLNNDFGDTVDRIMFAAKINDWLIAPAFDFPNEGISASDASGRPFDVSQLDDAYRLVGMFAYKHDKEEQEAMLKRGDWLINTGLYFSYRWQVLSFESTSEDVSNPSSGDWNYDDIQPQSTEAEAAGEESITPEFYTRDMWTITPDLWFQFLYGTFHFELEAALIYGKVGNPDSDERFDKTPLTLAQWGAVLQIDYGLLSDALRIGLEFGYAHGDKDVKSLRAPATYDQPNDTQNDTFTAFSFNPAYNTDLILYHHILGSVSQSLYLNGFVQYDFLTNPTGKKLRLRGDVIYSRAVYQDSTLDSDGISGNLGVELNGRLDYRSEDGFYAGVAYGVLFPLGGFKGDPDGPDGTVYKKDMDLNIPQTVQLVLGIAF